MLGCVETEGKPVTSQYFVQLYDRCKPDSVASTVSSQGGKQRHAQVYG